jgi:hypothetical protein
MQCRGQVEGGVAQAIGAALDEKLTIDADGKMPIRLSAATARPFVGRSHGRRLAGAPSPPRGRRCHCEAMTDARGIERSEMAPNVRHVALSLGDPHPCGISRKWAELHGAISLRSILIRPHRAFEERPSFDGLWGPTFPRNGGRCSNRRRLIMSREKILVIVLFL